MTTRNFRVHNGISVGDIVIDAATNKITGGATAAPSADGDYSNKKYVDDSIAAISTSAISTGNSNVTVTDSGTGAITVSADATEVANFAAAATTITASGAINLTAGSDVVIPANVGVTFGSGEKIEGDNTDLTITSGGAINLSSGSTVAVTGALTVTGDLTINGTTTTVASTVTTHADPLIELNTGAGSNANDLGFVFERGSTGNNAAIIWDESADKFSMGTTTATGSSTGDMSVSAGTLVVSALEGDVTGDLTGNADTATALATARNIGGVSFDGSANINLPGVNTAGNQGTSGTAAIATTVTAADESSDTSCNVLFVTAATGNLPPKTGTNLTFNSANGTLTTTTFVGDLTGTATAAEYSDVAERFASDSAYAPGTVVALGGAEEITQVNEEGSDEVFGVISSLSQAAFKMNGGAGNDATHPYIAMTGRVNVKVIGSVSKGDRLISASVPGYAKAAIKSECTAFNVIGRALTSKTEAGQGTVLAAVRVSH